MPCAPTVLAFRYFFFFFFFLFFLLASPRWLVLSPVPPLPLPFEFEFEFDGALFFLGFLFRLSVMMIAWAPYRAWMVLLPSACSRRTSFLAVPIRFVADTARSDCCGGCCRPLALVFAFALSGVVLERPALANAGDPDPVDTAMPPPLPPWIAVPQSFSGRIATPLASATAFSTRCCMDFLTARSSSTNRSEPMQSAPALLAASRICASSVATMRELVILPRVTFLAAMQRPSM
mmetsp:Transcript_5739/g.12523  ORF Transcript_5739/g.12523 Transcript_5739/m.12523 type:complete len:234 (-) Transcript_5739:2144-2845(-)